MTLLIDIPNADIPKTQDIVNIDLHFIDGEVCECTYPFEVDVLDKIWAEIEHIEISGQIDEHSAFIRNGEQVRQVALDIIDKYRGEK